MDVHVISGGLDGLADEAKRRGLPNVVGTKEAAEAAAPHDH